MTELSGPMIGPENNKPTKIVVLLHGYGSDGGDLISLATYWQPLAPNTLFVAPNAPQPCDINPAGYQWFAVDYDRRDQSWRDGTAVARPIIEKFLTELWEQTGLTAADTILGGFSQGAMMALDVGLRLDEPLLGIIAFSGGVIDPDTIGRHIKSKPPVLFVHGAEDEVVPLSMSLLGAEALKKEGIEAEMHVSPRAPHTIAMDGLDRATGFVRKLLLGSS